MAAYDAIAAALEIRNLVPCLAITFEGMASGGVLTPGFAAFASPIGTSLITIFLDYEGFSGGSPTTITKTIYPTINKRTTFDGTGVEDDITVSGSDITVRFALDQWAYEGCSNGTVNISSGVYTQGGNTNNSATGLSITNNITGIPYPTPKANFSLPYQGRRMGYDEFTQTEVDTGYYEVRVVAYNNEGIDIVTVEATGQTSSYNETITLTKSVDSETPYNDRQPVVEYIGQIPISGFTQGEYVDLNPVIYPVVGDTALDFSTLGNTHPTWRPAVHTVICDKNHTYGGSIAVVATDGNDGSGVVVAESAFNPASPPAAFATGTAAYNAIRTFNNITYGRNEAGGSTIYYQAGSYDPWGNYSPAVANTAYMVMAPFPGLSREDVTFTVTATASRGPTTYCLMSSFTIDMSDGLFGAGDHVILHNLDIQNVTVFYSNSNAAAVSLIGNDFAVSSQGWGPYSTNPLGLLVRGNYSNDNTTRNWIADVSVGNRTYNSGMTVGNSSIGYGTISGGIFANNYCVMGRDARVLSIGASVTNGWAIVNNVLIQPADPSTYSNALFWIYGDGSDADPCNDFMIVNNTILGERCNVFYNDYVLAAIGPGPRILVRIQNNICTDINLVTDIDAHGGGDITADDGARYGNHALVHGTWCSGNRGTGTGQVNYGPEGGAKNFQVVGDYVAIDFVDDQSGQPGSSGTGLGDYHLNAGASPIRWAIDRIIDYDADGLLRLTPDDAGAYSYSAANAGGGRSRRRSRTYVTLS